MAHNRYTPHSFGYDTLVTRWSHIDFTNPVPLVDRRDLELGDVVASSHGHSGPITEIHTSESPISTDLVGRPHLNKVVQIKIADHCSERYEGRIPLLADADGTFYGEMASVARARGARRLLEESAGANPMLGLSE